MKYLTVNRNIKPEIIEKYMLGYDPQSKRIMIPIYDQFGFCINIRRMGWLKDHRCKALNVKGKGEVRLYPEKDLVLNRKMLLVEGEFDCLVAKGYGLPAVTWTGGAGNWNIKYTHMFKDKAVWLCLDNDSAGYHGENLSAQILEDVTEVTWFIDKDSYRGDPVIGKDITEWSKDDTGKDLIDCICKTMSEYKFPARKKKV